MALIPGFEFDIFISYVHDDNEPEITGEDGWVDQFHQYLDRKLKKHDKNISIWWDVKNLRKAERFDNAIKEAVQKSAIMLCLYSVRYPKSEYCIDEVNWFYEKSLKESTGTDVGNFVRIIPIMLSNIDFSEWPKPLTGSTSFKFHDDGEIGDPLKITAEDFEKEMKLLRNDLVHIIKDLSEKSKIAISEVEKLENSEHPNDAFAIFFSEVEDGLYDRREGIMAELVNKGYRIIMGDESQSNAADHEKLTESQVSEADLIINLLGKIPGRKIKDDLNQRYIQKQIEIGLKCKKPSLVWLSSEVIIDKVENEVHRNFIKSLEDHTIDDTEFDFVQGNEGDLAKLISDYIEQIKQQQLNDSLASDQLNADGDIKVLLETHVEDFKHGFKLKKILSNSHIELIFNQEDGDPQENINSLYKNISEANKFIFVYGSDENKDWIEARIKKTLQKLTEFDRYDESIYVYMAPPHKEASNFKLSKHPLIKILDYSDVLEPDDAKISNFLDQIKGNS
jgi:transcription initiation factor IIE alpha subunit